MSKEEFIAKVKQCEREMREGINRAGFGHLPYEELLAIFDNHKLSCPNCPHGLVEVLEMRLQ